MLRLGRIAGTIAVMALLNAMVYAAPIQTAKDKQAPSVTGSGRPISTLRTASSPCDSS